MSPGPASRASITSAASTADRNLATPASRAEPPASAVTTLIQARPLAPQRWQVATSSSMRLRGSVSAPPVRQIPLTHGAWNTRAWVPAKIGVSSASSMPKRMSGLSEPKRSMASCQVMRSNSPGSCPATSMVASATAFVTKPSTSSRSTNDASTSSWENSNWRSARRSSSRRQRAIW